MARNKLPFRRTSITTEVMHTNAVGNPERYLITIGFNEEGRAREVFCANPMIGSDMHAILTDGCILLSIYLQTGGDPEKLIRSLGESREEGAGTGPPSSVFGAIAREILAVERDMTFELAKRCVIEPKQPERPQL